MCVQTRRQTAVGENKQWVKKEMLIKNGLVHVHSPISRSVRLVSDMWRLLKVRIRIRILARVSGSGPLLWLFPVLSRINTSGVVHPLVSEGHLDPDHLCAGGSMSVINWGGVSLSANQDVTTPLFVKVESNNVFFVNQSMKKCSTGTRNKSMNLKNRTDPLNNR